MESPGAERRRDDAVNPAVPATECGRHPNSGAHASDPLFGDQTGNLSPHPLLPESVSTLITDLAIHSNGRIRIVGDSEMVSGVRRPFVLRLTDDGKPDRTFKLRGGAAGQVGRIHLQLDGRIVVAGILDAFGGRPARRLARRNSDVSNCDGR